MSWFSRVKDKLTGKQPASDTPAPAPEPAVAQEPEPTTALGFYQRGLARCQRKQYAAAIADLDRALALRPRFAAALTERGLAYEESGDLSHALRDYDAAIAFDPSYSIAYANRIAIYLRAKRWVEARDDGTFGLRLSPGMGALRYRRGIAYEMLGGLAHARQDYILAIKLAPNTEVSQAAQQRLRNLPEQAHAQPEPDLAWVAWPVLTGITIDHTVEDLVREVVAAKAFFIQLEFAPDQRTYCPVYGQIGLCRRLSTLADVIGPAILRLKLAQLERFAALEQPRPTVELDDQSSLVSEGMTLHIGKNGDQFSAIAEGFQAHPIAQPLCLFLQPPEFDRTADNDFARRCGSCGAALAYYAPTLDPNDGDQLVGFACPHCGASGVLDLIEDRMRPGEWSRAGFLGEHDALREVSARDAETLTKLGVAPPRIGDVLDQLLTQAMTALRDRLTSAQTQLVDDQHRSGKRGFDGPARLPLGASLDDIDRLVRNGEQLPADRGVRVDHYEIFVDIYLGYQSCPYTVARPPWSDNEPSTWMIQHRGPKYVSTSPPLDLVRACSADHTYRHANLDFLIVNSTTHEWLRGAGLIAHLISAHGFFEGPGSPYRLDPERAARVLGLVGK